MDAETKRKFLAWYAKQGWPVSPWQGKGKPLTAHSFQDATCDWEQISAWNESYPDAMWSIRTGTKEEGGAGLVVIDIDKNEEKGVNGFIAWEMLREQFSDPIETVTVISGGGGKHIYFKYPAGHFIPSGANVLGAGVDIRASKGCIYAPPSVTKAAYFFEVSPTDAEIQDLPAWILERVTSREETAAAPQIEDAPTEKQRGDKNFVIAQSALQALHPDLSLIHI